ncbi:MAG: hypothetical protein EOP20_15400 [Hyphomicrobiales bacterium]|nr:MAG: hypothetical protein EOP20_15400 [Hyphomicrobiales bacterium]
MHKIRCNSFPARELIVALLGRRGPLSEEMIRKIAAVQMAIKAFEAVIDDMDEELACLGVGTNTSPLHSH